MKNLKASPQPILEPLDLCWKLGLISKEEKHLALRLRWLYIVNYGLPHLQAYDLNKIKGLIPSKYTDKEFCEIRWEYKFLIDFLHQEDRMAAKFLVNLVIFNKKPNIINKIIVAKLTKKKLDKEAGKEEDLIRRAFKQLQIFYDRNKRPFFTGRQKTQQVSH